MMASKKPSKDACCAAELWTQLTLQHGTAFSVVAAQIDQHEKRYGEKPSMVLITPSLWRPLILQTAKHMGVASEELVFGPATIYDVPIIFSPLQDQEAYLQIFGSQPSQSWFF